MLKIEDLADWLAQRLASSLGRPIEVRCHVMPDEGPAEMVVLNEMPGLQSEIEDAFDNPAVKARSRGGSGQGARDLAHAVDRAIVDARTPFFLASVPVIDRGRFGGSPWPVGVDRLERTHYECNYWATVAR